MGNDGESQTGLHFASQAAFDVKFPAAVHYSPKGMSAKNHSKQSPAVCEGEMGLKYGEKMGLK